MFKNLKYKTMVKILKKYREFSDLFNRKYKIKTGLPEHSSYNHHILLKNKKTLKRFALYCINLS